jgi:hypothetical protein
MTETEAIARGKISGGTGVVAIWVVSEDGSLALKGHSTLPDRGRRPSREGVLDGGVGRKTEDLNAGRRDETCSAVEPLEPEGANAADREGGGALCGSLSGRG